MISLHRSLHLFSTTSGRNGRGVWRLSLLSIIALVAHCQNTSPPLPFAWHSSFDDDDMLRASSVILVGRVQSLDSSGSTIEATDDVGHKGTWQMLRVRAEAENVLRGKVGPGPVEFYFYTSLGPVSGDWNSLHVGDRCVFFLISEAGNLRAVRDFWRSSIQVGSGRHRTIPEGESISAKLAAILLTPGEDLDERLFQQVIHQAVPLSVAWLGKCETLTLVNRLLRNPSSRVRDAAREQLLHFPGGQVECQQA